MLPFLASAAQSTTNIYIVLGIAAAAVTLFAAFGTASGRKRISLLFRGQSIQQMAAVSADQIAAVQSAYSIIKEENERLTAENVELRARVTVLERVVTAKAEITELTASIRELTRTQNENHQTVMRAIGPGR